MPEVTVSALENVGERTVAIELETPSDFDAFPGQFVLVRAQIDGEEETGYYTISSPDVEGTFEITVAVDPEGTLGPWLADREDGETIAVEGPFGDVQYTGDEAALVFAGGPGIGPAVGIGERARSVGREVAVVYGGSSPPHGQRLTELEDDGATVIITDDLEEVDALSFTDREVFVFGFEAFVEEVKRVLRDSGVDISDVEIESFGPE